MEEIKYSIIMLVNSANNLDRAIESIRKQNYDKNKVELIIIDNSNDEKVQKIKNDYDMTFNIKYLRDENKNYPLLLNEAINSSNGSIISFINSDSYYKQTNILSAMEKMIYNYEIVSIKSEYYDADTNSFVDYAIMPKKCGEINLSQNIYNLSLNLASYFFSKKIVEKYTFNEDFVDECFVLFLMNILEKYSTYYFYDKFSIITDTPFETNTSKNSIQYRKWWYIDSIDKFYNYYKRYDSIPRYIQLILLYIVHTKINCNIYDRNKRVLTKEESTDFFNSVDKLISLIELDLLHTEYKSEYQFKMKRWVRYFLLKRQIKDNKKIYVKNNRIVFDFKYKDKKYKIINNDVLQEQVRVYAINYKKGKLYFDCSSSLSDIFEAENIKIYAKYNGEKIEVTRSYFYPLLKIFGKTYAEKYCFNFSISIKDNYGDLKLYALVDGKEIPLIFNFAKVQARLCNSKRSFWHYKNFVLYNKINKIIIKKSFKPKQIIDELIFDISKLKNERKKLRVCKLIFLRMLYYITRPFYKNKHVWLTWDKLYKAGDNGEYMYQYCLKEKRNIYYFVKKDSPDYQRLHEQEKKRCVVFNSLKAKLLSLHSEAILDTHANVISYCGFDGMSRNLVCGLFNPEIICIQHGLTIQKIAQYQNRLFDNIKYYCCASQFEIDNIKEPFYDYSEEQMSLTGLARYDGLKSKDEKIILITPTWRRNVVNSSVAYIKKKHNDNFKNSDYFEIYNSLINNKELIECAKKTGYKIIYLLHPAMSGQFEDFTRNDYVEIIPATGDINYEEILTKSSLMVTDYSGVQFDFAYQRKVLVYYHPDKLPPHYDDGGLEYETMGFGPICKTEEQIVNELCNNMNNGCKIADKYRDRADRFFEYDDFNNCKRILNKIDEYFDELND